MVVLGLAGHVDHGKTSLVRALTGVDTDRLVEEKARGMTTDLGFASLEAGGVQLGIVDVPGHERYIRNMAAGAWGVDLALLVVAADDGWMAQTENHVRVLASFGPPRVIPVVTKIDLVDAARPAAVAADVFSRARSVLGAAALVPAASGGVPLVSAPRGTGLDALRGLLAREAAALEAEFVRGDGYAAGACGADRTAATLPAEKDRAPYLFVDRVFTKRGAGLVLCGTLRGGAVETGCELTVVSTGEKFRVRGIESLGSAQGRASARSRAALNVAGLKAPVSRGDLVASIDPPSLGRFVFEREFLARLGTVPYSDGREGGGFSSVEKTEVEFVVGSASRLAHCYPIGGGPFARLVCREALALPLDARGALVRHGGAEILRSVSLVRSGDTDRATRRSLAFCLSDLADTPLSLARALVETRLRGWSAAGGLPLEDDELARYSAVRLGAYLVDRSLLETAADRLRVLASRPGGIDRAALPSTLGFPRRLADLVAEPFLQVPSERQSAPRSGAPVPTPASTVLPPALAAASEKLRAADKAGCETSTPAPGVRRTGAVLGKDELAGLCALGVAVPVDRTFFLHADVYRALVAAALSGRNKGDRMGVADFKAATGFSRKYAIPFANRMERDGWVKRDGDERIVLRSGT